MTVKPAGVALLLIAIAAGEAHAAAPSEPVRLSWDAPTQRVDGTPLGAEPITYRVYRVEGGSLRPITDTASRETVLNGEPAGLQCWRVTALDSAGRESDPSAPACKTVTVPDTVPPEAPTEGAIEYPKEPSR